MKLHGGSCRVLLCSAERINASHESAKLFFGGMKDIFLANEGPMRRRLETTEIVVLNFWTWRHNRGPNRKQRSLSGRLMPAESLQAQTVSSERRLQDLFTSSTHYPPADYKL